MKKLVSCCLCWCLCSRSPAPWPRAKSTSKTSSSAMTAANNTFNMTTQSDAFGRMNYNGLTQGNYVYRDANGDLQPYFSPATRFREDGKVLDFTWHKGAIWHDGQPVTDEDIIFTFEFQRDVKKVGGLSNLVSVEITGENAARLTFSPAGRVLLPQHILHEHGMHLCQAHLGRHRGLFPLHRRGRCHWLRPVQAGGLRCGIPRPLTMRPCRRTRSSAKSPWTR